MEGDAAQAGGVPPNQERVPIQSFGGDTASTWEALRRWARRDRSARRAAARIERALRRLIRQHDVGGQDRSPRLDAARLVVELRARRCALARARREELALPLVVLACDVSGSCSATCDETLLAALTIAETMPHVLVIRHSNGQVVDVVGSAAHPVTAERQGISEYVATSGRPVVAVVAWGDWDAGDHYQALARDGAALYWLDSYCARVTGPRSAGPKLRVGASSWHQQPRGWWQGVADAATTAVAIEAMGRGC